MILFKSHSFKVTQLILGLFLLIAARNGNSHTFAQPLESFIKFKAEVIRYQTKNIDSSRLYIDSCIIAAKEIQNRFYLGDALQLKSRDFFMRGISDSALFYSHKSIELFKFFPDSINYFIAEYNLGNIYLSTDDHIKALAQFKKVLLIIDENFDDTEINNNSKINLNRAYCYYSIGIVYDHLEDYVIKLQNMRKALKIALKIPTPESENLQAVLLGNIGLTYFQLENYELAESYAIAGMEKKKKLGTDKTNGYNYQILAKSAFGRGKFALALKYLQHADKSFAEMQNNLELNNNQIIRARCYLNQKKYDLALEILHPLEKKYSSSLDKKELIELYNLLSEVYISIGDYKQANHHLQVAALLNKEMVTKNNKNAVRDFLSFYEEEEIRLSDRINNYKAIQEKEKLQIEVAANKEKEIWIYSLFVVSTICLVLIIIVIARGNRKNKRINQDLNYSIDEKQILFKEVHHRVKNNFQIISSLLNLQQGIEEDVRSKKVLSEAQGRIQSMALVHEMLYRKNEVKRILFNDYSKELVSSIVKSYSNENTKINCNILCAAESFDLELAVPLGLMLNEGVTNSVKYAFEGKSVGNIDIILTPLNENRFQLILKDDGVGIPTEFINGSKETLGIELITILTNQLGGEVKISNESGTEIIIEFSAV